MANARDTAIEALWPLLAEASDLTAEQAKLAAAMLIQVIEHAGVRLEMA